MKPNTICPPQEAAGLAPVDLKAMMEHAQSAAELLQALSNPYRLMILCVLADGELKVSDLNERMPLSQSALSQHLALLRKQALVLTRRQAQTIYYSVAPGPAMDIVQLLHNHFCNPTEPNPSEGNSHV